jgi:succinate dehydrogenase/fumarate reductase-like Fe-S protein
MEINKTIEFIWFLVQGGISILCVFILASIVWIVVTPMMFFFIFKDLWVERNGFIEFLRNPKKYL